jgi:AcrR family transcriptional regulator
MVVTMHPTAEQLISTVSAMLEQQHANDILVDNVLAASGVSRGSLYHHFGDFSSLVEATLLRRFAENVEADVRAMESVTERASTKEEYWMHILKLSAETQIPERAQKRAERALIISMAAKDEAFGAALAVEQERLTAAMAETIGRAQIRGWVTPDIDRRAIAVFIQAYSLGRSVDDISSTQITQDDWVTVVSGALKQFSEF